MTRQTRGEITGGDNRVLKMKKEKTQPIFTWKEI